MTAEEKIIRTREKHPGCVAHDHKLAARIKKRKEEILHHKEQSTEQFSVQSSVQHTEQYSVQSTVQSSVQSTVQSNDTYVYGVGILGVFANGVCVFFAYSTFQPKKLINENRINHQNDVICFRSYIINE